MSPRPARAGAARVTRARGAGIAYSSPPGPNNNLYQVTVRGDALEWSKPDTMGDSPPARWRHTATVVDGKLIYVFGGFQSSTTRCNDLWVLDTSSMEWMCPSGEEWAGKGGAGRKREGAEASKAARKIGKKDFGDDAGEEPAARPPAAEGAPSPRGGHTAVLIGKSIYVFGGYGGSGYQRRDFDDLYTLNVDSFAWERLDRAVGTVPERRSGHSAHAVRDNMVVYGGWNATQQFNDLVVLSTRDLVWTRVEQGAFGDPRWNHAAVSIEAVPNWQVFVFGGSGGNPEDTKHTSGVFMNDIAVLDTADLGAGMSWSVLAPAGTAPRPRADCSLSYIPSGQRLLLFGGWENRWYNDAYLLPIGGVAGPPYAIGGIEPAIGPITGGTKVTITGQGFVKGQSVSVKFQHGRRSAESSGTVVSETEVSVLAPSFQQFGPGEVTVRIACGAWPYSISSAKFAFFEVVDATKSLAFGPGLVSGSSSSGTQQFYVVARDRTNKERTTGTDEFVVRVAPVGADGNEEGKLDGVAVRDMGTGQYHVTYMLPRSGKYRINVECEGTYGGVRGHIRGSPFTVDCSDAPKETNDVDSNLVVEKVRAARVAGTASSDPPPPTHTHTHTHTAQLGAEGARSLLAQDTRRPHAGHPAQGPQHPARRQVAPAQRTPPGGAARAADRRRERDD